MKGIRPIHLLYLFPYLAIIALGFWYRSQITPIAFLNGDSGNYLTPAYIKALADQWHKGERPMQYLQFICITLSKKEGLKYTVLAQQVLSLIGGFFLAGAWLLFLRERKKYLPLWHLMGYIMLIIYVQSPTLMYYEQLIGPESPCIFVMCALIFCLSGVWSGKLSWRWRSILLASAIFINLFLIYPMPKWIFAGAMLELLLIRETLQFQLLSMAQKARLLILPHALFLLLVYAPEHYHKIDYPFEDRTYLEYEQMAYTHFDLLARNKTNFPVSAAMQDSLIQYFRASQKAEPDFLIGFSNDKLMWGGAGNLVTDYYKSNYDSIGHFYKSLCNTLITKYPWALTVSICKQMGVFYFPTHYAHKNLCNYPNTKILYYSTKALLPQWDALLAIRLNALNCRNTDLPYYLLNPRYPANMIQSRVCINEQLPFVFKNTFWFFRWFDHIFLFVMCSFFITIYFVNRTNQLNLVALLYLSIFIYAGTIAIVHTFDIDRFIVTIFPFILATTFLAMAETGEQWLDWTLPLVLNRFKKPRV